MTEPLYENDRPRLGSLGPVRVRVPAKINLFLGVGPLRPDGYHELTTVYQALALYDEVSARRGSLHDLHAFRHDFEADVVAQENSEFHRHRVSPSSIDACRHVRDAVSVRARAAPCLRTLRPIGECETCAGHIPAAIPRHVASRFA